MTRKDCYVEPKFDEHFFNVLYQTNLWYCPYFHGMTGVNSAVSSAGCNMKTVVTQFSCEHVCLRACVCVCVCISVLV